MNTAIFCFRLLVGLVVAANGVTKLTAAGGSPGLRGTAAEFEALGFRPPLLMAFAAGAGQAVGGVFIAAGFASPLAAAVVVGVMGNAVAAVRSNGFWSSQGGVEYPLVLTAAAGILGFSGPGTVSIDHALGWVVSGPAWGFGALGLALAASIVPLVTRRRPGAPGPVLSQTF